MSDPLRRHPVLLALLLLALAPGLRAAGAPTPVVYDINFSEPRHQVNALHNLQNQLSEARGEVRLVVVLHGAGLSLLLYPEAMDHTVRMPRANCGDQMAARIDTLRDQGVRFLVARDSARRHHIDPMIDLHGVDPEDLVPNGLAGLAQLQQQGYLYVKP